MAFREADRIPVGEMAADFEITEKALGHPTYYRSKWREYQAVWEGRREEVVESYVRDIAALVRKLGWDYVGVPLAPPRRDRYSLPEFLDDYTWREASGRVKRYCPESGGHAMTVQEIEMSVEDIDIPSTPVALDDSEFDIIRGVVQELGDTHFVIGRIDGGSFPWDTTVGMEAFLTRMAVEPEFVEKAIEAETRRAEVRAAKVIEMGCDAVSSVEDYSDSRGTIMGPERFRQFCLPSLQRVVRATHDAGGLFVKHSDGNHWEILDDFVDAGVDGWHGIQQRVGMDFRKLKERYGGKLCLFGGIECDTLVRGSRDEVRVEVLDTLRKAGRGGGLVFGSGNTLMVGVRYENYVEALDTLREYGNYPLDRL